jgi:hypothetical protein
LRRLGGEACSFDVDRTLLDVGGDRLRRVAPHRRAAPPAIQRRGTGKQQLEMVGQLGHRPDRRARGPHRVGLVDGDRRKDAVDAVDLGPVHAVQELPGVRRERLDVATLALGVDGVEDQRALPGARYAGDDHQLAQRNVEVELAQVVLPGAADADRIARNDLGGWRVRRGTRRRVVWIHAGTISSSPTSLPCRGHAGTVHSS